MTQLDSAIDLGPAGLIAPTTAYAAADEAISLHLVGLGIGRVNGVGGNPTAEAGADAHAFCSIDGTEGCMVVATDVRIGSLAVKTSGRGGSRGATATKVGSALRVLTQCGGEDACKIAVTNCI